MAADIEGLREFAMQPDRDESPFFVGRNQELSWLREQAALVLRNWKAGRPAGGRTTVVTGCPGMGKSSLLQHFQRTRCERTDDPEAPVAVAMSVSHMHTGKDVVDEVYRTLAKAEGAVGEAALAIGRDLAGKWKFSTVFDALRSTWRKQKSRMPAICLLVDEIQNASQDNGMALGELHEGALNLPILPVYAGLNDSVEVLRECGISRLSNNAQVNLLLLEPEDAAKAVERMLTTFRVEGEGGVVKQWVDQIAADSLNFPQHLHIGLETAARALLADGGMATVHGLERARLAATAERHKYYRSRINDRYLLSRTDALVSLVRVLAESNEPIRPVELERHARKLLLEHGPQDKPTSKDAQTFVTRLVHAGVLQLNEELTGYAVPIPSMQTWLLEDYGRSLDSKNR